MTLRIIATADSHLGYYSARMPIRLMEDRRYRLRHALGEVIDYAISSHADILVLAGDLFDTPNPRNPDRIYLARRLHELEKVGVRVLAIGGNHDTPRSSTDEGGYPPLAVYAELNALTYFGPLLDPLDPIVRPDIIEVDGYTVAIGGFTPNPNLSPESDPLDGIVFGDCNADLRVLVIHSPIESASYPSEATAIVRRFSLESLQNVDLVIAGDIHRYSDFRVGLVRVVIPGATELLDFGDADSGKAGFAVIEVHGPHDVAVHHREITAQPRVEIRIMAEDLDHVEDPTAYILDRLTEETDKEKLVRLSIEGTLSRRSYEKLNLTKVNDFARHAFFFFDLNLAALLVHSPILGVSVAATRRSIADEIRAVIRHRMDQSQGAEEKQVLKMTEHALLEALQ